MIEINNLSKRYLGKNEYAVQDLNIKVENGEIFGFLGPNGAGKSTTIKCITGILTPTQGSIKINDVDVVLNPVKAKQLIGFVPDEHMLYEGLTGEQFINFICDVYNISEKDRKERVDKYAKAFEIQSKLKENISSYSHGMKQKIAVICALVHNPEVFILDEPLTGLDPQSAFQLKTIMHELAEEGKTVFFSSHVLEVVEKLCTKIAIIDKGKLITICDIKELHEKRSDMSLEQLFLNLTQG